MQSVFGSMTIGASPVRIATVSDTYKRVSKIFVQAQPGSTGSFKVGGVGVTNDTTTPGVWFDSGSGTNGDGSAKAGGAWVVESQNDSDVLDPSTYYFHGTHAGDVLNWETHTD